MTSLCNYSHPEQQITEGLVRQKSGSLFPYNPEFYELATGLYGPGSIYCWQLLLASVILNWCFYPKDDNGYRRLGISNDLLAVLAYPAFAATDALVHAVKMLGMEYRALSIFCLRYPRTDLTGFAKFNNTQLDLRSIPSDILNLGQHVIDITGPVTVCYMFTTIIFARVVSDLLGLGQYMLWRPTTWTNRLIYVTYGYVVLILTVFHLSLGDLAMSFFLSLYEAVVPPAFIVLWGTAILISISCAAVIFMLIPFLLKKDKARSLEVLKALPGCVLFGVPIFIILFYSANDVRLVPDLAISISERDQLATLIVGIVTLCFTLYNSWYCQRYKSILSESQ